MYTHVLGTNVTAVCLHPGVIATELGRHIQARNYLVRYSYKIVQYLIKTPKAGAQTTLYCALDPEVEQHSGEYFRYTTT